MRTTRMMMLVAVLVPGLAAAQSQAGSGTDQQIVGPPPPPPAASDRVPERIIRISGGVMAGLLLTRTNPVYPLAARARRVEGAVVLHVVVGRDGHVESLDVVSGPDELRDAALDAVRQWTYKPYLLNGEPITVHTTVVVEFHLDPGAQKGDEGPRIVKLVSPQSGPPPTGAPMLRSGIVAGRLIHSVPPVYPPDARAAKVEGRVTLHAIIGRDGQIRDIEVVSGPDMLREAALDAVRQWAYVPYRLNGEPTEVNTTVIVNFNLSPSPAGPPPQPEP